jgi:hypothetical protein
VDVLIASFCELECVATIARMQHENHLLTEGCNAAHADTRSDGYIEKSFGGKHMHERHESENFRVLKNC